VAWPYKLSTQLSLATHTRPHPTASPALTLCMRPRQDGDHRGQCPRGSYDLHLHGLTTKPQARRHSLPAPPRAWLHATVPAPRAGGGVTSLEDVEPPVLS